MISIILNGCRGAMGQAFARIAAMSEDVHVVAGVDIRVAAEGRAGTGTNPTANPAANPAISPGASSSASHGEGEAHAGGAFPEYARLADIDAGIAEAAGALVDFSNPAALDDVLEFAIEKRLPTLVATTGHTEAQKRRIADASLSIPVFQSANLSVGVSLLAELARKAAAVLGGAFDVELVEKHHSRKVDAPSGTALMLADAVNSALPDEEGLEYVYSRREKHEKRGKRELGIHSVRGGTIVGEHVLIFAGNDEVIELRHAASSRDIFAEGAVRAARFIAAAREPKLYGMRDLI